MVTRSGQPFRPFRAFSRRTTRLAAPQSCRWCGLRRDEGPSITELRSGRRAKRGQRWDGRGREATCAPFPSPGGKSYWRAEQDRAVLPGRRNSGRQPSGGRATGLLRFLPSCRRGDVLLASRGPLTLGAAVTPSRRAVGIGSRCLRPRIPATPAGRDGRGGHCHDAVGTIHLFRSVEWELADFHDLSERQSD